MLVMTVNYEDGQRLIFDDVKSWRMEDNFIMIKHADDRGITYTTMRGVNTFHIVKKENA
jgi:hypothetical protein